MQPKQIMNQIDSQVVRIIHNSNSVKELELGSKPTKIVSDLNSKSQTQHSL